MTQDSSLYYIHDDCLTADQHKQVDIFALQVVIDTADYLYSPEVCACLSPLIELARKHYDLSSALYYEIWQQHNPVEVPPHVDIDEALAKKQILVNPLCSMVFYHNISVDMTGGELVLVDPVTEEEHQIKPKTNRLVVFQPDVLHWVNDYEGHRHSILCNPWNRPLGLIDHV